jgi:predicted O-methyltransferase YrrM
VELDPAPAPDGSTLHLYLDLYHRDTERAERTLTEATEHSGAVREELTVLARQDLASARAILRDRDAHQQLAKLDTAVMGLTGAELGDSYPEIRRIVESCLLDASLDGYRMSESGAQDAMVGEMVENASDVLYALSARIPAPVAHAKRRPVRQVFTRPLDDSVGRVLAVQAAHLRPNARVLEIGAGVGIATAWLITGLGPRTDVDILSVDVDTALSAAAARTYQWPSYVRIETADAATTMADHPDTFDLILADASASTLDHVNAIVDASRSGGMLIFNRTTVSATANGPDTSLTALRQTVLDHDKLVAVDIDWSTGLLIASKLP